MFSKVVHQVTVVAAIVGIALRVPKLCFMAQGSAYEWADRARHTSCQRACLAADCSSPYHFHPNEISREDLDDIHYPYPVDFFFI